MEFKNFIIVLIVLIMLTGCTTHTSDKDVANLEKDIVVKELDDNSVINLVTKAFNRRWRVDVADYNDETDSQFTLDGISYIYYSNDIDTIEEMFNYLNEVYTEEITNKIIEPKKSKIRDGRLYHVDGGMGTLMRWEDSNIKLISSTDKTKTYEFKIPTVDDNFEDRIVELVFIDKKGWRVNTLIDY